MGVHDSHAVEDQRGSEAILDLRPLLVATYRGRWVILAATVAGLGICGILGSRPGQVRYDAVATLAVNQPRSAPAGIAATPVASYRALLANYSIAVQTIAGTGLDKQPWSIGLAEFMRSVLSVEEVPGTNLIHVRVRLSDPVTAVKVANDVAARGVELSKTLNEQEGGSLRAQLESQRAEAAKQLSAAEQQLIDFKRSSQVELLRAKADAWVSQNGSVPDLQVDLSSERARADAAQKEQSSRTPTRTLDRTIDQSPALLQAASSATDVPLKSVLGLGVKTEEVDSTYQQLDEEVALARARIAELEQRLRQIDVVSAQFAKAGTLSALYDKETMQDSLKANLELARKVYEDVSLRYEQARVVVTSGSAQLQIVDPATALANPVSWSLPVWLAVGAIAGACAGLGGVFSLAVWQQIRLRLLTN